MNDYYDGSSDPYSGYDQGFVSTVSGVDDFDQQQQQLEDDLGGMAATAMRDDVDFDDPTIAALPRVLLMGPRRGGKTSIQVSG